MCRSRSCSSFRSAYKDFAVEVAIVIEALVQNWLRITNQQTTATSDVLTGEFTRRNLEKPRNTYCHRSYSSKEAGPGLGRQQQG